MNEDKKELTITNLEECAILYNEWTQKVKNKTKGSNYTSFNSNRARDTLMKALTKDKKVTFGKSSREKESGKIITSQAFIIEDLNIWKKLTCTKQVRILEFRSVIIKSVTVKYVNKFSKIYSCVKHKRYNVFGTGAAWNGATYFWHGILNFSRAVPKIL